MKPTWKSCLRVCVSAFLLYLAIRYWETAAGFLVLCISAAAPLLAGCVIAYLVNILMSFYERHYFPRSAAPLVVKSRRTVCMLAAFLSMLAIVALLLRLVIPELVSCMRLLGEKLMAALSGTDPGVLARLLPEGLKERLTSLDWPAQLERLASALMSGIGGAAGSIATAVASVFSGVVTVVVGLIFSIYLLYGKERLASVFVRLMERYLPARFCARSRYVLGVFDDSFHRYIVGQCIEAVVLGVLCALGMSLLRMPYAAMIGALVGFTALIPVAGAYIGAGVGAFMIFTLSPMQALWFLIFIVILQQVEGNLIYPKVVGSSVGLPALWVLAAVTIGGGLMGVLGMLLSVPVAAALYRLLREDLYRERAVEQS